MKLFFQNYYLQKAINYLTSFIELQLFITIMSLPVLIIWGIPISLLTFVGNFLFTPIITCFLFLSSFIFFCEIAHLPSSLFIYALTKISMMWDFVLNLGSSAALIGHAMPHTIILCALPCSVLFFLCNKKFSQTRTLRIFGYFFILLTFYTYIIFFQKTDQPIITLEYLKKKLFVLNDHNHVVVIDNGALGRSLASSSWCEYTLMPTIIKETGKTTIDVLVLTKPSKITFDVAKELCSKMMVKKIYLIMWTGTLPNYYWRSFFELKKAIAKNNGLLKRIGSTPITIPTSSTRSVVITPQTETLTTGAFSYNKLTIEHKIDNTSNSLV